jgi:hypothetical protein
MRQSIRAVLEKGFGFAGENPDFRGTIHRTVQRIDSDP